MKKYLAFGLVIETEIDFTGILQESSDPSDVLIRESEVPETATGRTQISRRGIRARFTQQKNCYVLNWEGVGKFKVVEGKEIIYQNLGADTGTLRLFLLSEVIGLVLFQRGYFLLHGSAIKIGEKARIFLGISGAGKSTTAAAFGEAGHIVLSDDMVVIKLTDLKPYVIPAFGQYKIWNNTVEGLKIDKQKLEPSYEGADKFLVTQSLETFPKNPVPLAGITILYPPNSRKKEGAIIPVLAPVELVKHFPLPAKALNHTHLKKHFQNALKIAISVEIRTMKRCKNFKALEKFSKSFS